MTIKEKTTVGGEGTMLSLAKPEAQQIVSQLSDDVGQLQILASKIEESERAAQKAREAVNAAKKDAERAKRKADSLGPVRAFHKKQAIEDLQDAVGDLASAHTTTNDAQIMLADAQTSLSESQRVTLECQEKIANLTKAMVQVGCASIATSQLTVRELEARMNGASKEELSELARNELLNVVTQIKNQQSLMGRQAQIEDILKEHDWQITQQEAAASNRDKAIIEQAEKGLERDKKIALHTHKLNEQQQLLYVQTEKNEEHEQRLSEIDKESALQKSLLGSHNARLDAVDVIQNRMIEEQAKIDAEHDRRLDAGDEKDKIQDAELARQAEKDAEHDRRLNAGDERDTAQDAELARQAEKDAEHDRRLNAGDERDTAQDAELARQAEKDAEHDRRLNAGDERDTAQDAELARLAEKDAEHDQSLKGLEGKVNQQNDELQRRITVDDLQGQRLDSVDKLNAQLQMRVDSLETLCTTLSEQIASNEALRKEAENGLEEKIDSRFTKEASIVSAIVGALGFIAAIVSFFF